MDLEPWAAYGLELQDLGPKGRGLVAGKDFRCGEVLFREKGFRAKSPEHLALEVLASAEARAQVSHLHTGPLCHLEGETDDEKFSRAAMPEPCPTEFPRKYSKVRFNSFELNGCCFLPIMALFNHSCAPNAAITQLPPHEECHTAMVVVAEQGIARGTEIVYSYNSDCLFVPLRERRKRLLSNWGFLCKCSRCQVEEEAGLEDDEEEPPEMPQLLSWEEVDLKNVNLFQARHEICILPSGRFMRSCMIFARPPSPIRMQRRWPSSSVSWARLGTPCGPRRGSSDPAQSRLSPCGPTDLKRSDAVLLFEKVAVVLAEQC
ncbi:unnamed protein product [Durusdinium trenchii]|uniref:SET domain-containing protein n=1 Tax=Durusdinium trenchii TaxID=1381693 RepID=A0ABP0QPQ6_9DINO